MKHPLTAEVQNYISQTTEHKKELFLCIRELVFQECPAAKEYFGYGMPAYKTTKPILYIGIFKNHVGIYPTSGPISKLQKELIGWKTSKGTIQFDIHQSLPTELIRLIIRTRLSEII